MEIDTISDAQQDKTFGEKIIFLGQEEVGKIEVIKLLAKNTPDNKKEIKKLQIGCNIFILYIYSILFFVFSFSRSQNRIRPAQR